MLTGSNRNKEHLIVLSKTTKEPACIMQTQHLNAYCTNLGEFVVKHGERDICLSKVAKELNENGCFFTIKQHELGYPILVVTKTREDVLPLEAFGFNSQDLKNFKATSERGVH